jgi:hypothetical protein
MASVPDLPGQGRERKRLVYGLGADGLIKKFDNRISAGGPVGVFYS